MADRQSDIGMRAGVSQLPSIDFSTGEAEAMDRLGDALFGLSTKMEDRLDDKARVEATRKGVTDGANQSLNHKLLFAPTIAGSAYTESASRAFQTSMELSARKELATLEASHPTDPKTLEKKYKAFRTGLLKKVPEEFKAQIGLQFDVYGQASMARSNKNLVGVMSKQAEAQAEALEYEISRSVSQNAASLFADDKDVRATSEAAVKAMRGLLVQRYNVKIKDAFGNEVPAFDPVVRGKAMREFDQTVAFEAIRGWYSEATKAGGAAEAYDQFFNNKGPMVQMRDADGQPIPGFAGQALTVENRKTLLDEMVQGVKFQNALEDRDDKLKRQTAKDYNSNYLRDVLLSPSREMAESSLLAFTSGPSRLLAEPETITKMRTFVEAMGSNIKTDPLVKRMLIGDILTNNIVSIDQLTAAHREGLNDEDFAEIAKMIDGRRDKSHFTSQAVYGEAEKVIKRSLGIPETAVISFGNEASIAHKAAAEAMNRLLFDTMDADNNGTLPANLAIAAQGQFDVMAKAREIAGEIGAKTKAPPPVDPASVDFSAPLPAQPDQRGAELTSRLKALANRDDIVGDERKALYNSLYAELKDLQLQQGDF